MLGRFGIRRAIRFRSARGLATETGAKDAVPRAKILPWLLGTVALGGGTWYFCKGRGEKDENPIKAASDIINVPMDAASGNMC